MSIPIANVYYLLCYAWRHFDEADAVDLEELEGIEQVHDLLAKVLAEGTFRLIKRGLDRGYIETGEDLAGVRGKIELSDTLKRCLRAKGRVACSFEELSYDVPHNQIIKSTLGLLLRLDELDRRLRDDVRTAHQKLSDVSTIQLDRQTFRRLTLDRNRRVYRFLISICALIYDQLIVDDASGSTKFRDFREDDHKMWSLFEDFVTGFYAREQKTYSVNSKGRQIKWWDAQGVTEADGARIPRMEADVLLDGPDRRIILDTKFYGSAFGGRHGASKLHSSNLYQLLAYLRNRTLSEPDGPDHDGILLYPVVNTPVRVDVRLEGFRIQARGIDLGRKWTSIHSDMLEIIEVQSAP